MTPTVKEIAAWIGGTVQGDDSAVIEGVTNSESPQKAHITFAQSPVILKKLEATDIECLIVPKSLTSTVKTVIQVDVPKLAWAKLLSLFYPPQAFSPKISPLAHIEPTARLGKDVCIEPFVYVGDKVEIGDRSVLRAHVYLDHNVNVGADSVLHSGVKVYFGCSIGNRVIIHAGSVIGADGFGYVATPNAQEKIPQVGNVVIKDDVELGACVTIDRATIGSTIVQEGTKIDNLVQVGHNVSIGSHTVISAQTGISGSTKIGSHVTVGGKAGFGDHVEIGDWTMVGAGSGFPSGKKVPAKQVFFGEPARPYAQARKQIAAQLRSAETLEELKALRRRVEELEAKQPEKPLKS